MKKCLMIEVEEITPEPLEKFKASGEWIKFYIKTEIYNIAWNKGHNRWVKKPPGHEIGIAWEIKDADLTHYLPNGLPSPDQAVEVFEGRVYPNWDRDEKPMHDLYSEKTHEELPRSTKVGVFKLPEVQS